MKTQIKRFALRALARMTGLPLPEPALIDAVRLACPSATASDIAAAVAELEAAGLISRLSDDLTGVSVTLTTLGQHKAAQLG